MNTQTLSASVVKTEDKINIEIDKDKLESFMNSCGLFCDDFLNNLGKSEEDHKAGRVTKRESLVELMD